MGSKVLESADGSVTVEWGHRSATIRDAKGKLITIAKAHFRDSFLYNWNRPCTRCCGGMFRRVVISEEGLTLGCTVCGNAISYANIAKAAVR